MIICCLAGFLLTACSNKITVKGEDGTEYESYQECCAAQDFQAAHQYLAKLKNSNSEELQEQWNEAKEYVFKQEALYLMSIGDETAQKRLIYLLKEEGSNNKRIDMLIELALDNDDDNFVKTLANHYNGGVDEDMLKKIVDYLSGKGERDNKEYLVSLLKNLNSIKILVDYAIKEGDINLVKEVASKCDIRDTDIITTLVSLNNKEVSDIIIRLLSTIEISGNKAPTGVCSRVDFENNHEYVSYYNSIMKYNNSCNQLLDAAIYNGNDYVAKKVLTMYKNDMIKFQGAYGSKTPDGRVFNNSNLYYIYYKYDSKNNAQKRYREAQMNGSFK